MGRVALGDFGDLEGPGNIQQRIVVAQPPLMPGRVGAGHEVHQLAVVPQALKTMREAFRNTEHIVRFGAQLDTDKKVEEPVVLVPDCADDRVGKAASSVAALLANEGHAGANILPMSCLTSDAAAENVAE